MSKESIHREALLLDEKRPGWYHELDTELLNLTSDYKCVLGQLWGRVDEGLKPMGFTFRNGTASAITNLDIASTTRFNVSYCSDWDDVYNGNHQFWLDEIKARFEAEAVPAKTKKDHILVS